MSPRHFLCGHFRAPAPCTAVCNMFWYIVCLYYISGLQSIQGLLILAEYPPFGWVPSLSFAIAIICRNFSLQKFEIWVFLSFWNCLFNWQHYVDSRCKTLCEQNFFYPAVKALATLGHSPNCCDVLFPFWWSLVENWRRSFWTMKHDLFLLCIRYGGDAKDAKSQTERC